MKLLTLSRRPGPSSVHEGAGHAPSRWLRQSGFTLVELSVSMAIASIMAVASLELLHKQLEQAQVSASSIFLQQTVVALQNFFVNDNGTTAIDTSTLASGAAVARQYVGPGAGAATQITNTWGGRMFLGSLNGDVRSSWVLQVSGLPMRLCADILQSLESSLNTAGLRHAMAGAAIGGGNIATPALGSVSLDPNRVLQTPLANVYVLKDSPFSPLNPAAMSTLCETRQPFFNLFLTGNKHAL